MKDRAKVFAPASVANVAVGFDLLGFSIDVAGDTVTVEKIDEPKVLIASVTGIVRKLPDDPEKNTATAGLVRLRNDLALKFGFRVTIEKGIPLGSGMGGSAASAVGAIVAANELLETPLSSEKQISYALIGEAQASGSYHADNVAPSLIGGMTLARVIANETSTLPEVEVTRLPLPENIFCVLINPELSVETKRARGILKSEILLKDHVQQSANLAGFIAGCFQNDLKLIGKSLQDVIVEPQRAHLIPGFLDAKVAAKSLGALGVSISGAGPSLFAWTDNQKTADLIKTAMIAAFSINGISAKGWAVRLNTQGARVIK